MASVVTLNGLDVSALDEREYSTFTLHNSLQVLLISDPKTEKAAAAMNVHVGHQSDPETLPGLAHFLEHMLFLGTSKYPDENSYKKFLSSHSGRSNASTSQMHTNFYFDVLSEHLHEALDRFSQFFIAPLFTAGATEREMNAVNSENAKNLQNDHRRLYQLQKSLSNPLHPFHKFGTGNLETLGTTPKEEGVDVRAALLEFHAAYYSASIMKLVICGKESLVTLKAWAEELFSEIKNTGRGFPTFGEEVPFDESRLARVVHVAPVKDLRVVEVAWPLPSLHWDFLTKPTKILSHLMGHEGPGSILSYLKALKWANGLSAGLFRDNEDWGLFCVKVDVTDAGIEKVNDVVEAVYQYVQTLQREAPFEPWIFREAQDLALLDFRFKSKESPIHYTSHLANVMHRYPPKYILSGGYVLYEYDADKVQKVLDLLTPQRMRLTVVSKTFEGKTQSVEKWYQTPYSEGPLDPKLVQRWTSPPPNAALKLPHRNEFICSDFRIVTPPRLDSLSQGASDEGAAVSLPVLLQQDEQCRLWYKPDVQFRKPKMMLHFLLYSPSLSTTPYHAVLTSLFVRYLKDKLTEVSYDAELAGMEYEIGFNARALELHVGGYSHKLPILLCKVLEQMLEMTKPEYKYEDAVFERVKDRTKRMYENFFLEEPYQHAVHVCSQLLEVSKWSVDDKIRAIEHLNVSDLAAHSQFIFQQVFVEGFFYGNLQQSAAPPLMQQVLQHFGFGKDRSTGGGSFPLFPSQITKPRIVQLADASAYRFQRREWNEANLNSAICTLYQLDCETEGSTMALRARLELFAHIFKEPCFNQLRTQEQLGYLVFSGMMRTEGVDYFRILIQSDVASPQLLDQRIELFVARFRALIADMPAATWHKQVNAVVKALLEKPKHEMEESMRAWREIANETFVFNRRQRVAAVVSTLQPRDLLAFFDSFIGVGGEQRSKLSICLYGAKHPFPELAVDEVSSSSTSAFTSTGLTAAMLLQQQFQDVGISDISSGHVEVIGDVAAFKQKMPLFPERATNRPDKTARL
ncbi:Insulin-degrading enzyme [Phytophthora rubi]|uniref:Insulin-degrading enzyme n=1 Tax=Phytophthora rubi TaxID=129364 RepID=A0A6A3JAY5_9STRA|nr:Insulin-degrading enzyme [Phytophthora rubi]